jgi:hypothetical protein
MGSKTQIYGDEVSFYFADDTAGLDFHDKGVVELSAPKTGPMAGILFYSMISGEKFKISSDSARKLLGTIYLPHADLEISGGGKVAQESAYTVILARRIKVDSSNLVRNADYAASDVPVPQGIGPNSSVTQLER